jgi:hypothetical protein
MASGYSAGGSNQEGFDILVIMEILVSALGSLASLFMMILMIDMNVWTDFTQLIFAMTCTQFVYDATVASFTFKLSVWMQAVCAFAGVSSFIISTYLAFVICHVLYFQVVFDFYRWKWLLAAIVVATNVSFCIVGLYGAYHDREDFVTIGFLAVTFTRLLCVFLNFIFFFISKYQVNNMTKYALASRGSLSNSVVAMRVLVDRIKYYPLMQAISRIPATIYEYTFGFNFGYYKMGTFQFTLSCISFLFIIIVPFGFFIIFLVMQPKAYSRLKYRLASICICFKLSNGIANDNNSSGAASAQGISANTDVGSSRVDEVSTYNDNYVHEVNLVETSSVYETTNSQYLRNSALETESIDETDYQSGNSERRTNPSSFGWKTTLVSGKNSSISKVGGPNSSISSGGMKDKLLVGGDLSSEKTSEARMKILEELEDDELVYVVNNGDSNNDSMIENQRGGRDSTSNGNGNKTQKVEDSL